MAPLALIAAGILLASEAPQAEDLSRAQARVESLYAAGSLPEALAEARTGLREHADDPILLRRTCQLALSLRAPEFARAASEHLAALVREGKGFAPDALGAWRAESDVLARQVAELEARERAVEDATVRARTVSLAAIAVLALALVGLAQGNRPPPSDGSGR